MYNKRGKVMKKICNRILLSIIVFISIILISNTSKAGELRLKNLDYKVQLNSDGTADAVLRRKMQPG